MTDRETLLRIKELIDRALTPSTPPPVETPEGIVRRLYRDIFGREADLGGLDYWAGRLREGMSEEALRAFLLESPEVQKPAKPDSVDTRVIGMEFGEEFIWPAVGQLVWHEFKRGVVACFGYDVPADYKGTCSHQIFESARGGLYLKLRMWVSEKPNGPVVTAINGLPCEYDDGWSSGGPMPVPHYKPNPGQRYYFNAVIFDQDAYCGVRQDHQ